ncbi:unnamed protein product [Lampetra planeri]
MAPRWISLLLLLLNLAALGTYADVSLSREPRTRAQTMPIFYKFTVTENGNVGQSELVCPCFSFLGFQDGINKIDSNTHLPFCHDYDPSRNLTLNVLCKDAVECFNIYYEDYDYQASSVLWNETLEIRVKGEENTNVVGFDCKYTRKSVNCSWERGHLAPVDTVYRMFYHYKDIAVQECPAYVVKSGMRVGCHLIPDERARSMEHHFYVNGTSSSSSVAIRPFYLKAFPASLCFTETPTNLHAASNDSTSISITWTSDCPKKCLSWVSIADNVSGKTETREVKHGADALIDLPIDLPFNAKRNLSIKVRTQVLDEDGCRQSAWSESLTLEPRDLMPATGQEADAWVTWLALFMGLMLLLLGLVILILVVGRRCKSVLWPKVSDPSVIFEELYTKHQGNFERWAGAPVVSSKEVDFTQDIKFSPVEPESEVTKLGQPGQ